MHPEEEHRLTTRQPFEQTVQLERSQFFTGEKASIFEIAQAIDIGPLGMGIKTGTPLQPKEMIRVYLPVQAVDIRLPVFSEVRWVKSHNHYYRAGLQFGR